MTQPTPFLDLTALQGIARGIRLKPGWSVIVYQDRFLGPSVRFTGTEPNSYQPGETVDLGVDSPVPPCRDRQAFTGWLLWRWCEIWVHEARETMWDGEKLVSDPHAE